MKRRRIALIGLLVLGVGMVQPRQALAATITGCPATEAALSADIATAGSGGTVSLSCPSATTIPFISPITISQNLTLTANGSPGAVTLDGQGSTGLFSVNSGVAFDLAGVTLAHSHTSDGAITNRGNLTVTNTTFTDNSGPAIENGLLGVLPGSTLIVRSSTFSGNSASAAIDNEFPATINSSTFSGNTGGAIFSEGPMTISSSTFSGNSAVYGGAIVVSADLNVTSSTFSDNSSTGSAFVSGGGAIYSWGDATITDSTFSGNSAPQGGAVFNAAAGDFVPLTLTITDSTFYGNSASQGGAIYTQAGQTDIGGTIIAHSSGGNCSPNAAFSQGYNLTDANGNCGLTGPTDLTNTDPLLDPSGPENNLGPTDTVALLPGSPAIDAGPATCTPATDQRGAPRPQGKACDIGAYELIPSSTQLLHNGSFEQGQAPWQVYSQGGTSSHPAVQPHTGSHDAIFCGYANCADALWQSFTVPAALNQAAVSLWLDIISQQPGTACSAAFYLLFLAPNGQIISPPLGTCNVHTNGWVQASLDVSSYLTPYKGQQVTLLFLGEGNATTFYLDDVGLLATTTAGAATRAISGPGGPFHPVSAPPCVSIPHRKLACKQH